MSRFVQAECCAVAESEREERGAIRTIFIGVNIHVEHHTGCVRRRR
jgi:hypothetical protein